MNKPMREEPIRLYWEPSKRHECKKVWKQCYYFPPNWGGRGGLFPPQILAEKSFPPQTFPPNLEVEKSSNSRKSSVFHCFWVRICSESVKNVIFLAAPAAGQRKVEFLVIFGHFGIFGGVLSPPNSGSKKVSPPNFPLHSQTKMKTLVMTGDCAILYLRLLWQSTK